MPDGNLIKARPQCNNPRIGAILPDYCFDATSEAHKELFEAHLLECDACWDEVRKLTEAVSLLRQNKALVDTVTPAELSRAFGPSARLRGLPFGGHLIHVLAASALYALYFSAILFVEVAYQWNRLGSKTMIAAPLVVAFMFAVTLWMLRVVVDRQRKNRHVRPAFSLMQLLVPIALVYAALCMFVLPGSNVTLDQTTGWTARLAYLKGLGYIVPIAVFLFVIPFQCVAALQGELCDRRHQEVLDLLARDPLAVPPRGAYFLSMRALSIGLVVWFMVNIPMAWKLLDSLEPGRYKNLFATFIFVRLGLYFGLALECLLWYQAALQELKREARTVAAPPKDDTRSP